MSTLFGLSVAETRNRITEHDSSNPGDTIARLWKSYVFKAVQYSINSSPRESK